MVQPQTKTKTLAAISGGLGLLALVVGADCATGYQLTLLVFYLLPILFVLRYAGLWVACGMAVLASVAWLLVNFASGEHYAHLLTPYWNAGMGLAVFLLVIFLIHTRRHIQELVDQRTASLREEIQSRLRLEQELLAIAESEQRRIGHDLHDSLGQHLTATAMAGKVLASRIASREPVDSAMADRIVTLTEDAIKLTRNLARSLHPISLGVEGLPEALQHLAASLSEAFNVGCRFEQTGNLVQEDPNVSTQLYRIAQEAAGNAIRHGHARHLVMALNLTDETLTLTVTDDGAGLPVEGRSPKGMGRRIMAYRANLIGADFNLENLPGGGVRAICRLNFIAKHNENKTIKN